MVFGSDQSYPATQDICESQEAWWLRKGCRRARCRLIKGLADAFEIPVRSIQVYMTSLNLALEHVLHGEGLHQEGPKGVQQGLGGRVCLGALVGGHFCGTGEGNQR